MERPVRRLMHKLREQVSRIQNERHRKESANMRGDLQMRESVEKEGGI